MNRIWTFLVTGIAVFMVSMDNLIVTNALPVIRTELDTGLEGLEWTVNAYTLTFAVLLLTGAALGDRFGRRRLLAIGLAIFTLASAAAALAPDIGTLVASRALQGVGGAIVMPLTLTVLADVIPAAKRGVAFGVWGAMAGLGVALGPVIGGAVVEWSSWQWIFWINVPIGLLLIPLTLLLRESRGGAGRLDPIGVGLATTGLFGLVYGIIRGSGHGWTDGLVLAALIGGGLLGGRVPGLAAAGAAPDGAAVDVPQPGVRGRQHRLLRDGVRHVRRGVPRRPVPADRPGLLAAGGGRADAAVDRGAGVGGADLRAARRPVRGALGARRVAGAAGDRHRRGSAS